MNQQEIVIYVYSTFSNVCNQFNNQMMELSSKFPITFFNIDNKKVRNMVIKSKLNKIKTVPCIIIYNKNLNKVEIHEGNNFINAFQTLYQTFVVIPAQQALEKQIQEQEMAKLQANKTSLDKIIDSPPTSMASPQKAKVSGVARFKPDPNIHGFSEDGQLMSVNLDKPIKGIGHSDMAISSLPEIGLTQDVPTKKSRNVTQVQQPNYGDEDEEEMDEQEMIDDRIQRNASLPQARTVAVKNNGRTEMIQDLTDLDHDESLMLEPADVDMEEMRSSGSNSRKEDVKSQKSNAVRMAAEEMKRMRELE